MLCYKYVDRNLQKIAFEMEGRQTFVHFYFKLTKIELYKNLPIDVDPLRGSLMFKQFKFLTGSWRLKTILGKYL